MQRQFEIGSKVIGAGNQLFVIAEAGSNHNQDLKKAKSLISIAADAGANAVKFQTFIARKLVARSESLADGTNLCELFEKFELPHEWHKELFDDAKSLGMSFISSPFDFESADLLDSLGVAAFKIASGDLTNLPLIRHIASKKRPVILSTGMGTLGEVGIALDAISGTGCDRVALLHCVSSYPAPPESMNLRAILTLKEAFKVPVGLSDHTTGLQVPIAAAALGIDLLEKHFTENKKQPGLDHAYSLEPPELKKMVEALRMIELALGTGEKVCHEVESGTKFYARRSLFAARRIPKGKKIEADDMKIVRPQRGILPEFYEIIVGRTALRDLEEDEAITWEAV
ncbi:N-acetylneuraminate synthase family protein [bacterium]|nr:N-acetylneuraminate synthase family protein [bacterium]